MSETISRRLKRLNSIIFGEQLTNLKDKILSNALSREFLLDAFFILYNECDKECLTKRDRNIYEFIIKHRQTIEQTKCLRINASDFTEKALIGKGYFGNVYLVTEQITGDIYAMKKIKKIGITATQAKIERDIMCQRNSEWITSLQYCFQDSDFLYLVMEYLPGGDLLSLMIRNGPIEEEVTKFYLAEISVALNKLHTMGYVHRDVKPENILIDRFGHIKLADFGNSASLDENGHVSTDSPVGTPFYIAPELLQSVSSHKKSCSTHDVTCDFWSLGIIGYEMVFESTPFYNQNIHETYSKILTFSEESKIVENIIFPSEVAVSYNFKDLIEHLITKPSNRLSFLKIKSHSFFVNIVWDSIHKQLPPFIPNVKNEEDISNFADIEKTREKRCTFIKSNFDVNMNLNEFSGKDLPFLGYGFIHEEKLSDNFCKNNSVKTQQLNKKIKEMQIIINSQNEEIKNLREKLFGSEKKAKQSESASKILLETKEEILKMKEKLKQKTAEVVHYKLEVKSLQSSLKCEEVQRLKSDSTISEVLSSTYKKWEKAKAVSDQNYEKLIAEKKTEIINLTQKLLSREREIESKNEDLKQLRGQIDDYKQMLIKMREQTVVDKKEFEKILSNVQNTCESNLKGLELKLKEEKDKNSKLSSELRDSIYELNESIISNNSNLQAKKVTEKTINEMKQRLCKEVELNSILRLENNKFEKLKNDTEKANEILRVENEKLKQECQIMEAARNFAMDNGMSSQYQSAHGSLTDLRFSEEQLRNDLAIAKDGEERQRNRADQLEKIVYKLEDMIAKINEQPKSFEIALEKHNEKYEDKLVTAHEQIIVERQSARTANLSLWKIEKRVEDLQNEKKSIERRLNLTEEKVIRLQNEKQNFELRIKDLENFLNEKDHQIKELKEEIKNIKNDLKKEHELLQKAETERMQEKSENVVYINRIHSLNEKVEDLNQKLLQAYLRQDSLNLDNTRLLNDLKLEKEQSSNSSNFVNELQIKLKSSQENYEMLKVACSITDQQLSEIEILLNSEIKRNKLSQDKIDNLLKIIRENEEMISQLKKDLNIETSKKIDAENKIKNFQLEYDELEKNMNHVHKQLILQQNQLISNTNDLFGTQAKLELVTTETTNLQIITSNFENEVGILKEENSKILTELFLTKERNSELVEKNKISNQTICKLEDEINHLNNSVEEQKHFYLQRDIKSDATLKQHKKLIDYLQLKVEDLSQKRKRSFKIFGSVNPNNKKENINSNNVESSILYRTLQEELNREKQRNKVLQEQFNQFKNNEILSITKSVENFDNLASDSKIEDTNEFSRKNHININSCNELDRIKSYIVNSNEEELSVNETFINNHRFELNIDNINKNIKCKVCCLPIILGCPHWFCNECKCKVHRKCRSEIKSTCICDGYDLKIDRENNKCVNRNDEESYKCSLFKGYKGDFMFNVEIENLSFEINCALDLTTNSVLLGTTTGLYSYELHINKLTKIDGFNNVQFISVSLNLFKVLIIANKGSDIFQCDLRQLQNRANLRSSTKPQIETTKINLLPITKQQDKFYLIKISDEIEQDKLTTAIAVGLSQIIIMNYDINLQNFIPVFSLQFSSNVMALLFTRHTVIISSEKFLEMDLTTYAIEEFIDFSDPSLNHLQNYQSMNIFNVGLQEFLVCFAECGIFVDEYGCRSRPYDLTWEFTPTGFLYQQPILYVAHFQLIQVICLHRSYRNDVKSRENTQILDIKRCYLNMHMPNLIGISGRSNCYSVTVNKENGIQELFLIDGVKALKAISSASTETLSSEDTCFSAES